jgi:EAL and modified HD-GYP domain-containing signal transduction protein
MAEQLAPWTSACPDRAFTVGLFSLLGALVRRPLPDVLAQLPFDERTTAALLHRDEPEGRLLRAIEAHERGETPPVEIPPRRVAISYRAAVSWCDAVSAAIA